MNRFDKWEGPDVEEYIRREKSITGTKSAWYVGGSIGFSIILYGVIDTGGVLFLLLLVIGWGLVAWYSVNKDAKRLMELETKNQQKRK